MNILCIDGSPNRNGKTISAVKRMISRTCVPNGFAVEFLALRDLDIKPCLGCYSCNSKGFDTCPLNDDIKGLLEKMSGADGLVLSAPTYTENVPALTKLFFDRLNYLYHRPVFFGKPALIVSTVGFYGVKGALKQLGSIRNWGFHVVDEVGIVPAQLGMKYKQSVENGIEKRIDLAARVFGKALRSGPKYPFRFADYVLFQAIKASSLTTRAYTIADYHYYKDKEYYTEKRIPFLAVITGKVIGRLVPLLLKHKFQNLEVKRS